MNGVFQKNAQDYGKIINNCWNRKFLWRSFKIFSLTTDKECHRGRLPLANNGGEPFRMSNDRIGIRFLQSDRIRREHMVSSSHHWLLWRFHHFLYFLQRKPSSLANRMLSGFHWLCGNKHGWRTCSHTSWLCCHGKPLSDSPLKGGGPFQEVSSFRFQVSEGFRG